MTTFPLNSRTIGAIRRFAEKNCQRGELKQFLLEAGAKSERILKIKVSGNMKSPDYKSRSTILNEGFDTIYDDFEKPEADGILIELVRVIFDRKQISEEDRNDFEKSLPESDMSLSEILESGMSHNMIHSAINTAEETNLKEAEELLKKALIRSDTDPTGAITAAVSAAESVCREALSRLNIPEPSSKQLPKYLIELRRRTNIEELTRVSNVEDRVIKALSSLVENSYQAAHATGDRHAHGDTAAHPSPLVVDMLVTSSCAIAIILAKALQRNEFKLKSQ